MGLQVAAATDTGRVRKHNEDSYVVGERLWAVADGMGGQAAGATASRIAAQCLASYDKTGDIDQGQISSLVGEINSKILAYSARHPKTAGMGTTLAGMALTKLGGQDHWLIFNVGDSRVYRLNGGILRQETTDHSEVQELVNQGKIRPSDARTHPNRNILTRCLGTPCPPLVGMRVVPCQPGDRMLICSDGLTSEVDDGKISVVLRTAVDPREAVDELIEAALENGGRDNVSIIVVGIDEEQEGLVEDTVPVMVMGNVS